MAERRVYDRLEHMLAAAVAIERLAAGMTLDDYAADPDIAASVERYLDRPSPDSSRTILK